MNSLNFPVFLIEYNQSKTNGWVNKYAKAESFKSLFLNKSKEIDYSEIKKIFPTYNDLYEIISVEFQTSSNFIEEKLKEIHDNIQTNLDKVARMKSKIENSNDNDNETLYENNYSVNSAKVSSLASVLKDENSFKLVDSKEDPLASPQKLGFDNMDTPLPAHLNNNALWPDENNPELAISKLKYSSNSVGKGKGKHRYHHSVSVKNPDVQKEFWKNVFLDAERRNLEICLLEKYAVSHRRLLENIIKAVEILFRYQPTIFTSDSSENVVLTDTTPSDVSEANKIKKQFVTRIEENIWPKLWLSKPFLNICLLKLSKLYDEIRYSKKFYLEHCENLGTGEGGENNTSSIYHSGFNSSSSSLQGLLSNQENSENESQDNSNPSADTNGSEAPKKNVDNKSFVRKSIKYWVHPDYVTEVKSIIMRHLPIYVFGDNQDLDHPKNPLISSVYYDNHNLELYHHRLHKTNLAIAFRYRWYGELKWNHQMSESEYEATQEVGKSEVFAERKTHKEDWTGDNSIKERFSIDPSKINDFNSGHYIVEANDSISNKRPTKNDNDNSKDKERYKNLSPVEEDEAYFKKQEKLMAKVKLAHEIQATIIDKQLRPTMRTIYNRTAFQLPDDQRVRVSLDTELTFVREDLKAKKGEWKRDDVGMHWPYRHLKSSEKYLFPYAVLEVKLQTQFGQEPPQWINELTSSYLVEAVPKFSKFMHGCAMLIPEKVKINPYWFYRMYENNFDLRSPLNIATLRETTMCQVKMPWNIGNTTISNFDFISPTLRRSITTRSNRIQRPTRREPKVSFANERLFLKYYKIGVMVCNVSIVIYYYGNPILGISYTFAGILFIMFGHYVYQWREKRIQHNPNRKPLDSMPAIYVLTSVLVVLYIFNLTNIYMGRYSTSAPAKLEHIKNHNVIDHRH
ncbi:hypothetical protein LY90DRAFT_700136 [Neocallimastix californiae]|jgi:SPX domain protein involved in polyphosphate accumulation|uniref:VTC domain-containing protein n=1 Tax=Neocallimastix californiae TaxID=1754190 RepID=A0A1Y2EGG8_9FUNG|nr:hypothetical protein LY90DRAFT_700136 [Neocallimastix californiae]|eukprot:ORY70671.1 hypothetical protein LY90DRAFT_700136 [Neocallimastix californiae]